MPHMSVDEHQLALKIKELIHSADLENMTVKSLRLELESYFNVDLAPQKPAISRLVKDALQTKLGSPPPPQAPVSDVSPAQEPGQSGEDRQDAAPIVVYSASSKEEQEEADRLLAFKLHAEELRRPMRQISTAASRASAKRLYSVSGAIALPKKKARAHAPDGSGPSLANGFPESRLSPALSEFLDGLAVSTSSRATKLIWEHIKAHQLQDPKDKRYVLCDEKLFKVLGKSRIHMFHIAKELHKHLYPLDSS